MRPPPHRTRREAFSFQVATDSQEEAKRAFDAMMTMQKIDVARIDAARRG